jgi:hypothetical protein
MIRPNLGGGSSCYATTMTDKIFHLQEWAPRVREVAEDLMVEIKAVTPELEVLFMGAAALGLPGKNDLDLDILCTREKVAKYANALSPVLGKPKEINDEAAAWEFMKDGFEIDCMLSDPVISHVPAQKRRFELLKTDGQLLEEYRQLKIACDGLPYAVYEERKKAFFDRISE